MAKTKDWRDGLRGPETEYPRPTTEEAKGLTADLLGAFDLQIGADDCT